MTRTPDENGIIKRTPYMLERYARTIGGGQVAEGDYFSFLYKKDDVINKNSPTYLKGKYLEGKEGDQYIQSMMDSGQLIKV
jgi:hypothetical protein